LTLRCALETVSEHALSCATVMIQRIPVQHRVWHHVQSIVTL